MSQATRESASAELLTCPCCGANPPGPLYRAAIEASSLGPRPNLASLLAMIMHQLRNTYASGVNGEETDLAYMREIEDGITKLYHAASAGQASPAVDASVRDAVLEEAAKIAETARVQTYMTESYIRQVSVAREMIAEAIRVLKTDKGASNG